MVLCKRCGRKLIAPESVERGYGPVCWEKEGKWEAQHRASQSNGELEALRTQIEVQRKEIDFLKQRMHELEGTPISVPSQAHLSILCTSSSKIPLVGNASEYISELQNNDLFLQMRSRISE